MINFILFERNNCTFPYCERWIKQDRWFYFLLHAKYQFNWNHLIIYWMELSIYIEKPCLNFFKFILFLVHSNRFISCIFIWFDTYKEDREWWNAFNCTYSHRFHFWSLVLSQADLKCASREHFDSKFELHNIGKNFKYDIDNTTTYTITPYIDNQQRVRLYLKWWLREQPIDG